MKESDIVEFLTKQNDEFRKLSQEHRDLDGLLSQIDSKRYLSAEEEVERKRIQKQKLLKKDRMAELVREYKNSQSN